MTDKFAVVGHSERRVDGHALVTGKPVFVADLPVRPRTLHLALVTSPHAHARIRAIDTSRAEALSGVALVLTHENTPDRLYTTAGQGFPEPSPYDTRMFNPKVRFVGDRVAVVAADTLATARAAAATIEVDYDLLPPVLSIDEAVAPGAPLVHDEPVPGAWQAEKNIAAYVEAGAGNVDSALAAAAATVDVTVETHYGQHAPLEPHVVASHLDDDGRLVLVSSTQVPFHVRRIVARLLDVPVHRIRVIKPRIGGGFGVKQEVLIEDLVALTTLRTGRPASLVYTREQEFHAARTRHPMRVRVRLGATADGTIDAIDMDVVSNTGAYGTHSLTVLSNVGSKTLPLYNRAPNLRFVGRAVYTNLPVAGAYRGYGATQGQYAMEVAIDQLAGQLGMDPLALRSANHIRTGGTSPIFRELGEGREGVEQTISSCELATCIELGADRIGWTAKRGRRRREGSWVHGVGMSIHMQGSGIPLIDMAAASIKLNDDGSINLAVGATDLGTGSDTVLGQIAAEVLGIPLAKVLVTSSDTDLTPFDTGAYASSTTYVSGMAVRDAAQDVREQLFAAAAEMLHADPAGLEVGGEHVTAPDGRSVSLEKIALRALYGTNQHQIAATASAVPELSPPPFLASFAEVAVDTDTGRIRIVDYVLAADCGTAINPRLAEGQIEGAVVNGIGYALSEDLAIDEHGRARGIDFGRYKLQGTLDLPPIRTILVDSYDPTGPMGAKSIAEIGINAPLPTIANAVHDATGVWLTQSPFTAERVWHALREGERS
ncbi:MAG TPA: molybdopterin cofactor-binding domain-containing protein [Egicoccus sp.]|nr:molybdopterin cofactor-binding domain-containing protein [Egicoccus sp.]HSK22173.1 molybdopterin cofactor-binding domain-containing protein [Egicoccus sp.]